MRLYLEWSCHSQAVTGGQAVIESNTAGLDGGAIFSLAPVELIAPAAAPFYYGNNQETILAQNKAGGQGGAVSLWAEMNVGFGHRLVLTQL